MLHLMKSLGLHNDDILLKNFKILGMKQKIYRRKKYFEVLR